MTERFFEHPILNSPDDYPRSHWELVDGQPANRIIEYVTAMTATRAPKQGHLKLFRNFDQYGQRLPRPNTLPIDSEQLESGGVSVLMLAESCHANTVMHILGIRALLLKLLLYEQVVGRALRKRSYDQNEEAPLDVEYAYILGTLFDFTANPVMIAPAPLRRRCACRR
jgi:hypothetical protein